MLKNYLKIALRNIFRHKAYSIINISGLAIGMAASILILLWVQNELSYDRFHKHADKIYRITSTIGDVTYANGAPGLTQGFQMTMPVIKNSVRFTGPIHSLFSAGERKFEEDKVLFADSTLLEVFSFPLLKGDFKTALQRPDAVLITRDMARKYFGTDDVIGKILRKDNTENLVITGVLANVPTNSNLQFDFVMPLSSPDQRHDMTHDVWTNFICYDYVQLDDHFVATAQALIALENQMNSIYKEHYAELKVDFHLQPLTSIHLQSNVEYDPAVHGDMQYVKIFFVVAIFILIIACINFMNLATARSARRAKEVGLRKVVGAVRQQLIAQFLGESLMISFLSLLVAIILVGLALPSFNTLAGKTLSVNVWDAKLLCTLIGISFITGLIAGSYPALFLSGFQPVEVLKGNLRGPGGNRTFRDVLVVIQFVVSIVLLIGTVVIYEQLGYIRTRNLGYDKENLLYMSMKGSMFKNRQALYTALSQDANTAQFAVTSDLPTNLVSGFVDVVWPGKDPHVQTTFLSMDVNESFFDIFRIRTISGRTFSKVFKTDTVNYILNETAVKAMGMTAAKAPGQQISFRDQKGTIVGVVADFNFKPIHRTIEPLIMRFNTAGGVVVVRTKPGATDAAIASLSKISRQFEPAYPFSYSFIDQDLANQYKGEQQMGSIFNLFAVLAVFISFLGLYGLSAYMAEQRTKEIGVRKILGASLFNIVRLLSEDFTRLVLIAIIIAIPLSWWAVNKWLQTFAYHIQVGWLIFALAPLGALFIAWLTVSYESIRAGVSNPVKSIRSE